MVPPRPVTSTPTPSAVVVASACCANGGVAPSDSPNRKGMPEAPTVTWWTVRSARRDVVDRLGRCRERRCRERPCQRDDRDEGQRPPPSRRHRAPRGVSRHSHDPRASREPRVADERRERGEPLGAGVPSGHRRHSSRSAQCAQVRSTRPRPQAPQWPQALAARGAEAGASRTASRLGTWLLCDVAWQFLGVVLSRGRP